MKAGRITAALALLTLATCHTIANTGLRYNRSPSVPTGWYWINHSNRTPKVGDYVAFCLPTSAIQREATRRGYLGRGPCPGNASALLKIVVAGPGDAVEVRGTGVLINDLPWPNSAPVSAAIQRKAVTGHVPIEPGQYFLMSENDPHVGERSAGFRRSLFRPDARYAGSGYGAPIGQHNGFHQPAWPTGR